MCTQPLDGVSNLKGSCVLYKGCCSLAYEATLLFRPWARPQFITTWANSYSTRKHEFALRVGVVVFSISLCAIAQASQYLITPYLRTLSVPGNTNRLASLSVMRNMAMHSALVLVFSGRAFNRRRACAKSGSRTLASAICSSKNISKVSQRSLTSIPKVPSKVYLKKIRFRNTA